MRTISNVFFDCCGKSKETYLSLFSDHNKPNPFRFLLINKKIICNLHWIFYVRILTLNGEKHPLYSLSFSLFSAYWSDTCCFFQFKMCLFGPHCFSLIVRSIKVIYFPFADDYYYIHIKFASKKKPMCIVHKKIPLSLFITIIIIFNYILTSTIRSEHERKLLWHLSAFIQFHQLK